MQSDKKGGCSDTREFLTGEGCYYASVPGSNVKYFCNLGPAGAKNNSKLKFRLLRDAVVGY